MFKKPITTEFFTFNSMCRCFNTFALLSFKLPFLRYGDHIELAESKMLFYLGATKSKILSFYNGRSALYQALKIIGVSKQDEIIVSGYTCISVVNAVIQSKAKIVYSDINTTNLGFDIQKLKQSITPNTKAIIVQHTFGKPSDIIQIQKITKQKGILLIEDCAHSLGSKIEKTKLGTYGDFSIFSTSRDKVISSVSGGFLIINNKEYFENTKKIKKSLQMPSKIRILKDLFYNTLSHLSYNTYNIFNIGKIMIHASRKTGIMNPIISEKEKNCNYNKFHFALPNALAFFVSKELEQVKYYSQHRILLGEYYDEFLNKKIGKPIFKSKTKEKNNYFRYPILLKNEETRKNLYKYVKKHNIILGDSWSGQNIVPISSNMKRTLYKTGTCPVAEDISKRILLLPNHVGISIKKAEKTIEIINNFKG